jgi:hypothetical protein
MQELPGGRRRMVREGGPSVTAAGKLTAVTGQGVMASATARCHKALLNEREKIAIDYGQ